MFDDLVRKYKQEKGINDIEQAKKEVRGERGPAMQITPGPAKGFAQDPKDDRTGTHMPDEKYWNARWPSEEKNGSEKGRQLLTDAKS